MALVTQGAVNWDNIMHRVGLLSRDVLSRCAAANVDPYTLVFGQIVAYDFPLPIQGHRNIQDALASLPLRSSFDSALWFGFGIKSLARTLGTTDQGCSLLALCAALTECFLEDYASEVLHHLAVYHKSSTDVSPALSQWLSIVQACAGVLTTTKFTLLADTHMRLTAAAITLESDSPCSTEDLPCPGPSDLADVLHSIGQVLSKKIDSIYIVGPGATGWIAAFAEWLFDMRVCILNELGAVIYANCEQPASAHVTVQAGNPANGQSLHVATKSYHLADHRRLVRETLGNSNVAPPTDRVAWSECLKTLFGRCFERFMQAPEIVGIVLACDSALCARREKLLPDPKHHDVSTAPRRGYLDILIKYLTELSPVLLHIGNTLTMTNDQLVIRAGESLQRLRHLCSCSDCTEGRPALDQEGTTFCLVAILYFIIDVAGLLSDHNVGQTVFPLRSALADLYWAKIPWLQYGLSVRPEVILFSSIESDQALVRLAKPFEILMGSYMRGDHAEVAAISFGGVCAYREILEVFSADKHTIKLFSFIPGRVEWDGKAYASVKNSTAEPITYPHKLGTSLAELDQLALSIMETPRELYLSFIIKAATRTAHQHHLKFGFLTLASQNHRTPRHGPGLSPCRQNRNSCWNRRLGDTQIDFSGYPFIKTLLRVNTKDITLEICIGSEITEVQHAAALALGSLAKAACFTVCNECVYCAFDGAATSYISACSRGRTDEYSDRNPTRIYIMARGQDLRSWLIEPYMEDKAQRALETAESTRTRVNT